MKNFSRQCFAGSLLIAATMVLAACGTDLVMTGRAEGPVPWIDANGTPLAAPAVNALRECRAVDLQIGVGRVGAHLGRATQELLISNTAANACFFAAPPLGVVTLGDGSHRTVMASPHSIARLDLAPGQTARLVIGTPAICPGVGRAVVASNLRLALSPGQTSAIQGVWVNVECGPPMVMLFQAEAVPIAGIPASGLRATLTAPATVSRGTALVYMVTLSNPTSSSIPFGSCPSYTESLGTPPTVVKRTLLLNCASALTVAAGQSIAFEMKISVPKTMNSGVTKLSWDLEVPLGAARGTTILVN